MAPALTTKIIPCVCCGKPILQNQRTSNNQITHDGECRGKYDDHIGQMRRGANRRRRGWAKTVTDLETLGIDPRFMCRYENGLGPDGYFEYVPEWNPNFYPNPQVLALIRVGIRERRRNIRKAALAKRRKREQEARRREQEASMARMKASMDKYGSTVHRISDRDLTWEEAEGDVRWD